MRVLRLIANAQNVGISGMSRYGFQLQLALVICVGLLLLLVGWVVAEPVRHSPKIWHLGSEVEETAVGIDQAFIEMTRRNPRNGDNVIFVSPGSGTYVLTRSSSGWGGQKLEGIDVIFSWPPPKVEDYGR